MVLLEAGVSRRHARLFVSEGRVLLEDLESANGTSVNGERLTRPRVLREGDELEVGSVVLGFRLVPDAQEEEGPAPHVSSTVILPVELLAAAATPRRAAAPQPLPDTRPLPAFEEEDTQAPAPTRAAVAAPQPAAAVGAPPPAVAAVEGLPTRLIEVVRPETGEEEATDAGPRPLPAPQEPAGVSEVPTNILELPLAQRAAAQRRKLRSATAELQLGGQELAVRGATRAHAAVRPAAARAAPSAPVRAPSRAPARAPLESRSPAERARLRRELSGTMAGQLELLWLDMGPRARLATLGTLGLLTALVVGVLAVVFAPTEQGETGPVGPEPDTLSSTPVTDSFGLGEGVVWVRPDMKVFGFEFVAPTRAVALLHYQSGDISTGEVSVSLNGQEVGEVPADVALLERESELVLPPTLLRRGARNELIFDSRRNPPGREPWRVWNVWLEVIPMPELTPAELLASARERVSQGNEFLERRDVGSDNLFKAWKAYRGAWVTLEALPERPELYEDVRFRVGQLRGELDALCGRLMLDFQRALTLGQRRKARQALEDVSRHFPTGEHRCHNVARARARELEL